jgi:hypothetical protein
MQFPPHILLETQSFSKADDCTQICLGLHKYIHILCTVNIGYTGYISSSSILCTAEIGLATWQYSKVISKADKFSEKDWLTRIKLSERRFQMTRSEILFYDFFASKYLQKKLAALIRYIGRQSVRYSWWTISDRAHPISGWRGRTQHYVG